MSHAKAYKDFFLLSDAGQNFLKEVDRIISTSHEKAENDPEHARDYVQRAKGAREVKQHIDSTMVEIKKGKPSR